jgi:hypothetical protein
MWRQVLLLVLASHLNVEAVTLLCNLRDTVNISSGFIDQHGHFNHDGVIYTKGFFGEFDYVVDNLGTKIKVDLHPRGCICEYRPCIRICCRQNRNVRGNCMKSELLSVPVSSGEEKQIDLVSNEYGILEGNPCREAVLVEPDEEWIFTVSFESRR